MREKQKEVTVSPVEEYVLQRLEVKSEPQPISRNLSIDPLEKGPFIPFQEALKKLG